MSTSGARVNMLRSHLSGKWVLRITSLVVLVIAWYYFGEVQNMQTVSSPALVAAYTYDLLVSMEWISHTAITLVRLFAAFTISMVVGVVFALILGVTNFWEEVFKDYVVIGLTTPGIIVVIFAAMLFGTGNLTPIVAGAILSLASTVQIVYEAVKDIDDGLLEMSRAFDVSRWATMYRVAFKSVMPAIFTAARINIGGIFTTITLAEFLASSSGLGFMIQAQIARSSFTGLISWGLIIVTIIMILEYGVFAYLESRAFDYRQDNLGGVL